MHELEILHMQLSRADTQFLMDDSKFQDLFLRASKMLNLGITHVASYVDASYGTIRGWFMPDLPPPSGLATRDLLFISFREVIESRRGPIPKPTFKDLLGLLRPWAGLQGAEMSRAVDTMEKAYKDDIKGGDIPCGVATCLQQLHLHVYPHRKLDPEVEDLFQVLVEDLCKYDVCNHGF